MKSVYEGPEKSPGFLLWHISGVWRGRIEGVLRERGLTHPQFVVLAAIGWLTKEGEGVTQAFVGKLAGLDPNTTSQVIRGLEQKGLVEREVEGRVKRPNLTKKGQKILSAALPAVEAEDGNFFAQLDKKDRDGLVHLFQKLLKIN